MVVFHLREELEDLIIFSVYAVMFVFPRPFVAQFKSSTTYTIKNKMI